MLRTALRPRLLCPITVPESLLIPIVLAFDFQQILCAFELSNPHCFTLQPTAFDWIFYTLVITISVENDTASQMQRNSHTFSLYCCYSIHVHSWLASWSDLHMLHTIWCRLLQLFPLDFFFAARVRCLYISRSRLLLTNDQRKLVGGGSFLLPS